MDPSRVSGNTACCAAHNSDHCVVTLCSFVSSCSNVLCCALSCPAADYARIVKDLSTIGDTADISASKDAVKFSTSGDIGRANVTIRCATVAAAWIGWVGR